MRVRGMSATGVVLVLVMMVGVVMMMVFVLMMMVGVRVHVQMAIVDMHMAGMSMHLAGFMPNGDRPENHQSQDRNAATENPGMELRSQQII
jgi:hypothetical protein